MRAWGTRAAIAIPQGRSAGIVRLRSWLVFALVLALCLGYVVTWHWWVDRNTQPRYVQQPPGASAEWDGATFRVTALEVVDAVDTTGDGPREAIDGAVWIEATVEVSSRRPDGLTKISGRCMLDLLGPDAMTWTSLSRFDDRPERCNDETTGATTVLHLTYLVPESVQPRLFGLVVPSNSAERKVIRP